MTYGGIGRSMASADPWGDASEESIRAEDANTKTFIRAMGESMRRGMAPPGYDEADAGLLVQNLSNVSNRRRTLEPEAPLVANLAILGQQDIIAALDAVFLPVAGALGLFPNSQVTATAAQRAPYEGMLITGVHLDTRVSVTNLTTGEVYDDYNDFVRGIVNQRYSLEIVPGTDPDNSLVFNTAFMAFVTPPEQLTRFRTVPAVQWANQDARMNVVASPVSITGAAYTALAPGLVGDAINVNVVCRFTVRTRSPNNWGSDAVLGG